MTSAVVTYALTIYSSSAACWQRACCVHRFTTRQSQWIVKLICFITIGRPILLSDSLVSNVICLRWLWIFVRILGWGRAGLAFLLFTGRRGHNDGRPPISRSCQSSEDTTLIQLAHSYKYLIIHKYNIDLYVCTCMYREKEYKTQIERIQNTEKEYKINMPCSAISKLLYKNTIYQLINIIWIQT